MSLWIDSKNVLHDDMGGAALSLPSWPDGMVLATTAQIDAVLNPPPSANEIISTLTAAVQNHLDATARARNYDGILSLCSYATSTSPQFGPEGLAGVAWRDAVWEACYAILADVQAGSRQVPTANELMAELPAMVWPA